METIARLIDTGTDELLCEVRERVAVITLNRPQARNSLSDQLSPALREMIRHCADDAQVGAVMITGAGAAFCAGGDVKGMGSASNPAKRDWTTAQRVADLQDRQRRLTGALVALRKPTLAALPGPAAGAGLSIALACDLRIAAQSAFVATGYLKVGTERRLRHHLAVDPTGRPRQSQRTAASCREDRRAALPEPGPLQPRGAG